MKDMKDVEVHIVCNDKEDYIKIKGSNLSLLATLGCFVNELKETGIDKKLIEYSVKQGLMTDEELEQHTKENIKKMKNFFNESNKG